MHNSAILNTANQLPIIYFKVCTFTYYIVLNHLRAYVTIFLLKTLSHNRARIYDAYFFYKSVFFLCAIIVFKCIFEMIEGSFVDEC